MMMRDNGTRKNFPPQEKTVLLHQAVATRGKTREKDFKKKLPRLLFPLQEDLPAPHGIFGNCHHSITWLIRTPPGAAAPCRKRHVDGISCQGQSSRTEILAGLDAGGAAFSLLDQKFTVTLKNKKGRAESLKSQRHPISEDKFDHCIT